MATITGERANPIGSDLIKSKVTVTEQDVSSQEPAPEGDYPLIPNFQGKQFPFARSGVEAQAYKNANQLYALSSHGEDHHMRPGLIVCPIDTKDIQTAVIYANANHLKLSIKSGGHQYSGACSTEAPNIMLDLSLTFKNKSKDMYVYNEGDKAMVKVSVSQSLGAFNTFLGENKVFVPHGQCAYVHVGGHGQTGGYGNLARSFGLFGDHIRKITLVDHEATEKTVSLESTEESDRALFSTILGGSPGNFGIITHYDVEVHRDSSYKFKKNQTDILPQYYRGIHLYKEETVQKCLSIVADMADNPDFPNNYDLCISVLSATFPMSRLSMPGDPEDPESADMFGSDGPANYVGGDYGIPLSSLEIENIDESDTEMMEEVELIKKQAQEKGTWPRVVVIYAQWVPFSADDNTYDPNWFKFFEDLPWKFPKPMGSLPGSLRGQADMSSVTRLWLFGYPREFPYPYEKRTYLTASKNLTDSKWAATAATQIEKVVGGKILKKTKLQKNCYLAVQIQPYGGTHSKYFTNATNPDLKTSYSWRDSSVVQVLDCFSNDKPLRESWQAENDSIMTGKGSCFGEQDRRVLWGSYGDWDMKNSWQYYYENKDKYENIGRVRAQADPKGTFTPNVFAVEAASQANGGYTGQWKDSVEEEQVLLE